MAVCSEVKRTLVKSPPELWSELSDPESLARHLDGVGEVKITRAEPEAEVEWEADGASGSVRLEPSGFGTKVTLSLSREAVEPAASPAPEAPVETEATVAPEPVEQKPVVELEPVVEPEPVAEPQPVVEPRPGFFARLFKRRRKQEPEVVVEPEPEPVVAEPEPEPEPAVDKPEPKAVAADLAALEAQMAEQDEALLTAMLDRLGAAHHRPFSRS